MWITVTSGEPSERTMHKEGLKRTNRAAREDMLKRVSKANFRAAKMVPLIGENWWWQLLSRHSNLWRVETL